MANCQVSFLALAPCQVPSLAITLAPAKCLTGSTRPTPHPWLGCQTLAP